MSTCSSSATLALGGLVASSWFLIFINLPYVKIYNSLISSVLIGFGGINVLVFFLIFYNTIKLLQSSKSPKSLFAKSNMLILMHNYQISV